VEPAVRPKGLLNLPFASSSGAGEYGWGSLSEGSAIARAGNVNGFAGHLISICLITGTVGLAVACWRHPYLGAAAVLLPIVFTAHPRSGDRLSRAALLRGRAADVMLRGIRTEAIADTLPAAADERRARRTSRAVAVLSLMVLLLLVTVYALVLACHIGTDLKPPTAWLAGQFDGLAQWWHALSPLQKILVGAGVAALIALSGGSLGLALGGSGAFTYAAGHGAGAADFTRDPVGATRSWPATTTPAGVALDLAEFALTFAPGNFVAVVRARWPEDHGQRLDAFVQARRAMVRPSGQGVAGLGRMAGPGRTGSSQPSGCRMGQLRSRHLPAPGSTRGRAVVRSTIRSDDARTRDGVRAMA
jgi:hypothetical protein